MKTLKRFENWFNVKFGWFFTNGRKTVNYMPIMKGTLSKTSRGWVVKQVIKEGTQARLVNLYPLHPDDCKRFDTNGDSQSCIVEFEIITNEGEPLGSGEHPYKQYVKLI